MKTVLDLIKNALYTTGAIAIGEQVDPDLAKMAMLTLNAMRAEWSGTYIDNQKYDYFFLNDTTRDHITIGSYYNDSMTYNNGQFFLNGVEVLPDDFLKYEWDSAKSLVKVVGNIPERPAFIENAVLRFGNVNLPLDIKTYSDFRDLPIQNIAAIPSNAYLTNSFPIQEMYFFPNMQPGQALRIEGYAYFAEYENIGDQYMDVPELFNAQVYNLAIRIAPMLGVQVTPSMTIAAHSALKHIKARNFVMNTKSFKSDFCSSQGFNFWAGI